MSSAVSLVKLYWELSKPKIVMLLVFTGIAGMLVAYKEVGLAPSPISLAI